MLKKQPAKHRVGGQAKLDRVENRIIPGVCLWRVVKYAGGVGSDRVTGQGGDCSRGCKCSELLLVFYRLDIVGSRS